jgi:hypothetical protein
MNETITPPTTSIRQISTPTVWFGVMAVAGACVWWDYTGSPNIFVDADSGLIGAIGVADSPRSLAPAGEDCFTN